MGELVLVKLGGSLITDKRRREAPRTEVLKRLATEIAAAFRARPDLRLVLGHGSGSFGHFAAADYRVHEGCLDDWFGYAATGAAARRLNALVTDALLAERVPAVSLQASASARCRDGELEHLEIEPVRELLRRRAVPLVYGDVALDAVRGCTIVSTEQILCYIARRLPPARIVVAGEVDGVFTADPQRDPTARLVPALDAHDWEAAERWLSTSFGVDVTGGMASKVRALVELVREQPGLRVRVISGRHEGLLERVLLDPSADAGTLIGADS